MKPQNLIKKCWLLAPLQTIENLSSSEIAYYFSVLNTAWTAVRTLPVSAPQSSLRHRNFQAYLFPCCTCSSVWIWGISTALAYSESTSLCDCTVFPIQISSASCLQAMITFHQQRKGGWGQQSPVRKKNKAVLEHTYAQIVQPGVKCFCRMCPLYYYSTDTSISAVSITFSNTRHQAPPRRHQQLMRNPNYCYWTKGGTKSPSSANKESRQEFWMEFSKHPLWGMHMLDPHLFFLRKCRNSSRASSLLLLTKSLLHKLRTFIPMQGHSWPILMPFLPLGSQLFNFGLTALLQNLVGTFQPKQKKPRLCSSLCGFLSQDLT